jgi:hypothetical protein
MSGMADGHHADPAEAPAGLPSEHAFRHEQPEDWGWHHSWGKWSRVAGWVSVVALCIINVTTYYNTAQAPWLYGIAGFMVLLLIWDRQRRKNAWRT